MADQLFTYYIEILLMIISIKQSDFRGSNGYYAIYRFWEISKGVTKRRAGKQVGVWGK
jgi:hypothetical protein